MGPQTGWQDIWMLYMSLSYLFLYQYQVVFYQIGLLPIFFLNILRHFFFSACSWVTCVLSTQVLEMALLDFPGLLFFSTYTLLVLFWAEIYHQVLLFLHRNMFPIHHCYAAKSYRFHLCMQARSLPIDKLRPSYLIINGVVYGIQVKFRIF